RLLFLDPAPAKAGAAQARGSDQPARQGRQGRDRWRDSWRAGQRLREGYRGGGSRQECAADLQSHLHFRRGECQGREGEGKRNRDEEELSRSFSALETFRGDAGPKTSVTAQFQATWSIHEQHL